MMEYPDFIIILASDITAVAFIIIIVDERGYTKK
jgi:hypothetical protein